MTTRNETNDQAVANGYSSEYVERLRKEIEQLHTANAEAYDAGRDSLEDDLEFLRRKVAHLAKHGCCEECLGAYCNACDPEGLRALHK